MLFCLPPLQSLPVLYLYERFSFSACRSAEHCVRCGVLTVQATTGLHLFSQAIARMKALLTGTHLPHDHTHSTRPLESHGVSSSFHLLVALLSNTTVTLPTPLLFISILLPIHLPYHLPLPSPLHSYCPSLPLPSPPLPTPAAWESLLQ